MKEKQFLRWMFIRGVVIVGIYLVVTTIMGFVLDNTLVGKCLNLTNLHQYFADTDSFEVENLVCHMDNPDLIEIKSIEQKGDEYVWTVVPTGKGTGKVYVEIENTENGNIVENTIFNVTKRGLVIDMATGNFSHYRERQVCIILFMIASTILLWAGYVKSVRELRFSYHSIFCAGLGIWMLMITNLIIVNYLQNKSMGELYGTLQGAASRFTFLTFPLILIFAILLSISNISLIRHEGFRFNNLLGIILSCVMVFGFFALFVFENLFTSGSDLQMKLWETVSEFAETVYAVLECFLIGAIICGSRAAKYKPDFDKDYIVILGCMIKQDGTLYPLIRGRVDRAIRFYQEQLKATGKKAIFIPSGGKGSDEPISEGEAMQRYLLEQGIEAEQILAETNSKNTRQNMQFSKELVGKGKKAVFSTTNFHVFRSGIIAGQVGFEADGIGAPTKWYFWPNAYIREVIGMLSYKKKSLVLVFIPIVSFLTIIRFVF